MLLDIVSVFPDYFSILNLSLLGKAQADGLVEVRAHNLRDWTHDVHHSVDDTPVGGGAGMVMKPEIWASCLDELLGMPALDVDASAQAMANATADLASSFSSLNAPDYQSASSPADNDKPVLIFPDPSAPLFRLQLKNCPIIAILCLDVAVTRVLMLEWGNIMRLRAWMCVNIRWVIMFSMVVRLPSV